MLGYGGAGLIYRSSGMVLLVTRDIPPAVAARAARTHELRLMALQGVFLLESFLENMDGVEAILCTPADRFDAGLIAAAAGGGESDRDVQRRPRTYRPCRCCRAQYRGLQHAGCALDRHGGAGLDPDADGGAARQRRRAAAAGRWMDTDFPRFFISGAALPARNWVFSGWAGSAANWLPWRAA